MKRFRSVLRSVAGAVLVIALLVVIASMIDTRVWWLDLPSQFRWHEFVLFAVATAVVGLWPGFGLLWRLPKNRDAPPPPGARHPWFITVPAVMGLILTGVSVERMDQWPSLHPLGNSGLELRIIHFNLGDRSGNWRDVLAWLQRQQADVIFLQEARPAFERELDASPLAKFVVYRNVRPDSRGTIALVTGQDVKLIEAQLDTDTFAQTQRQLVTLKIEKNESRRTLLSVHMCRPTNATEFAKQSYEIEQLGRWFDAHPEGIATGDCNCTAYSPRLASVIHSRHLVAQTSGTWPTPLPSWFSIGIDALLVPERATVDAVAGPDLGSDHRPLIATIAFP